MDTDIGREVPENDAVCLCFLLRPRFIAFVSPQFSLETRFSSSLTSCSAEVRRKKSIDVSSIGFHEFELTDGGTYFAGYDFPYLSGLQV
jgi:hypothetical protein